MLGAPARKAPAPRLTPQQPRPLMLGHFFQDYITEAPLTRRKPWFLPTDIQNLCSPDFLYPTCLKLSPHSQPYSPPHHGSSLGLCLACYRKPSVRPRHLLPSSQLPFQSPAHSPSSFLLPHIFENMLAHLAGLPGPLLTVCFLAPHTYRQEPAQCLYRWQPFPPFSKPPLSLANWQQTISSISSKDCIL